MNRLWSLTVAPAITILFFAVAAGDAASQSKDDSAMMKRFVGTWRLVSWTQRLADGTTRPAPYGAGYIIYTDTNQMCAVIINPNRPKWKSAAPAPDEAKIAIDGLQANCNTVEIHWKEGFVLHHVELDKSPNAAGTIRKRWFKFEGPNRLILRVDPAENIAPVVENTVVWERMEKRSK